MNAHFVCIKIVRSEFTYVFFHCWQIFGVGDFARTNKTFLLQGTEVKAITYSAMQIRDEEDKHEVYVIIDI